MKSVILILACVMVATAAFANQSQSTDDFIISGQVFDELGNPAPGVRVCAHPDDYAQVRQVLCSYSKPGGDFAIAHLRPVGYRILTENDAAGYFPQFPFFKYPASVIPRVVLTDTRRTATIVVSLPPKNGQLVGKAIDATTRRPVDNLKFLLCQVASPQTCWMTHAKNAEGTFRIFAAHVPFTMRVEAEGYEPWFGANGADINESISIPSAAKVEILLTLRRTASSVHRALDETEKQAGVNLPAPEQTSPPDRAELDYFPRKTTLEWKPVDGAAFYRVEIDYCNGLVKPRTKCVDPRPHYRDKNAPRDIVGLSFEFDFVGAQPGRWRVWAVDEKGQEGFKSPWRIFFYLQ